MLLTSTAQYVALYRALETFEHRREPLFRDEYAAGFLPRALAIAIRLEKGHDLMSAHLDRLAPGVRLVGALRTRFIDDVVRERARDGVRQLIVLGAGFDCRAHRLSELSATRVFEVDRADMGAPKRAGLGRMRAREREDVQYVSVDLMLEDPIRELVRAGWESTLPTLFLCEGVTSYLDEPAVLRMLDWIGRGAPKSCFVFSYVHRGLLDGTFLGSDSDRLRRNNRAQRDPWTFGIDPGDVGNLLARHGLALREELSVEDCRRRYLGGLTSDDNGSSLLICARVAVADI